MHKNREKNRAGKKKIERTGATRRQRDSNRRKNPLTTAGESTTRRRVSGFAGDTMHTMCMRG
jgi:hypothetical protein